MSLQTVPQRLILLHHVHSFTFIKLSLINILIIEKRYRGIPFSVMCSIYTTCLTLVCLIFKFIYPVYTLYIKLTLVTYT